MGQTPVVFFSFLMCRKDKGAFCPEIYIYKKNKTETPDTKTAIVINYSLNYSPNMFNIILNCTVMTSQRHQNVLYIQSPKSYKSIYRQVQVGFYRFLK